MNYKVRKFLLLFSLSCSLFVQNACEQYDAAPKSVDELQNQISGLVQHRTRNLPFTAPVAWAMVKNGKTETSYFQGREVPDGNIAVSGQSQFILASASKLFTSVMLMIAVEEGKIQLSAKVADYLNNMPSDWNSITINQLLSHSDGLPDVMENSQYTSLPLHTRVNMSRTDYLSYAAGKPLHFKPGVLSRYGQTGFVLLSLIIEKVYNRNYESVIQEKILTPLEMTQTYLITHESEINNSKPQIFEPQGDGFKKVTPEYVYADYATAGIYSNLEDMIKFFSALHTHQLLRAENFKRLYTPVKELSGFALGWEYRYKDGELMTGHSGGWSVVVMHLPKSNTTSIFLSSAVDESILDTGYQVAEKIKQYHHTL